MAIVLVNVASAAPAGSSTTVATPAANHTAGNLLFVFARRGGNTTDSISISDTASNTYTAIDALIGETNIGAAQGYYAKNIVGNASNVVTATFPASSGFRGILVMQYSGLDTVAPLDAHLTGSGVFTTAITSGTFSTVFANEVVVQAATVNAASAVWSAALIGGSLGTIRVSQNGDATLAAEDNIFSTTMTNITAEIDSDTGTDYCMQVATFKAASATTLAFDDAAVGPISIITSGNSVVSY